MKGSLALIDASPGVKNCVECRREEWSPGVCEACERCSSVTNRRDTCDMISRSCLPPMGWVGWETPVKRWREDSIDRSRQFTEHRRGLDRGASTGSIRPIRGSADARLGMLRQTRSVLSPIIATSPTIRNRRKECSDENNYRPSPGFSVWVGSGDTIDRASRERRCRSFVSLGTLPAA